MSQLFQQLNQQPQSLGAYPQINSQISLLQQQFQKCKMMSNPIEYINNLPEMKNILGLINQNGGNAKQFFYKLAEQRGVNPDTILSMFK